MAPSPALAVLPRMAQNGTMTGSRHPSAPRPRRPERRGPQTHRHKNRREPVEPKPPTTGARSDPADKAIHRPIAPGLAQSRPGAVPNALDRWPFAEGSSLDIKDVKIRRAQVYHHQQACDGSDDDRASRRQLHTMNTLVVTRRRYRWCRPVLSHRSRGGEPRGPTSPRHAAGITAVDRRPCDAYARDTHRPWVCHNGRNAHRLIDGKNHELNSVTAGVAIITSAPAPTSPF